MQSGKIKRTFLGILICIVSCSYCLSQEYSFQRYTFQDGLISNNVTAVIRDSKGILWVGTHFGVNWFDGTKLTTLKLPSPLALDNVNNFFEDNRHNVFISTFFNGIFKYSNGIITHYLPDPAHSESSANTCFEVIQLDQLSYLVCTDRNLYLLNNGVFSLFDDNNNGLKRQITGVASVDRDNLVVSTSIDTYWYKKINNKWTINKKLFNNISVNSIVVNNGKLYAAFKSGVAIMNLENEKLPLKYLCKGYYIHKLIKGQTTELWAVGDRAINIINDSSVVYPPPTGLAISIFNYAYTDQEMNSWLATDNGLMKLNSNYKQINNIAGKMGMVISAVKDKEGALWLGTFDGLIKIENQKKTIIQYLANDKIGFVYKTFAFKDTIFFLSDCGILIYHDHHLRKTHSAKCSAYYLDPNGSVWLGSKDGSILKYNKGIFEELNIKNKISDIIASIYTNSNLFIIGYYTVGIKTYIKNKSFLIDTSGVLAPNNGSLKIRSFYINSKKDLYFGTRNRGIILYHFPYNSSPQYINSGDGLSGNWVKDITEDKNGNIILATDNGLNVLKASAYNIQPAVSKWNTDSKSNSSEINFIYKDSGNYIFGNTTLYFYNTVKPDQNNFKPALFITHIMVPGVMDSTLSPGVSEEKYLTLNPSENNIIFDYTCTKMHDQLDISYSYMLKGATNNWSVRDKKTSVSFAGLQPGRYQFLVNAFNGEGDLVAAAVPFNFTIKAPFWRTWWFIDICIALFLYTVYSIYRYRLYNVIRLQKVRGKISADLHDDMGSTLSSIAILSDLAIKNKSGDKLNEFLYEIKDNALQLMEKMDDIVWSINPQNDSLDILLLRIRKFASGLFEAKNIEYQFTIGESIGNLKLTMEARRDIYLLLKEAINNLVKYAGCTEAGVFVTCVNRVLEIRITDNGCGFNPQIQKGNGLINMKNRAIEMGGDLVIKSVPLKGTDIILTVKIV